MHECEGEQNLEGERQRVGRGGCQRDGDAGPLTRDGLVRNVT